MHYFGHTHIGRIGNDRSSACYDAEEEAEHKATR
jgi:hypothetical protein